MKKISLIILLLALVTPVAAQWAIFPRPEAKITADKEVVASGESVTLSWVGKNGSATLDGEPVELTGAKVVTVSKAVTFTLKVTGKRRSATDSITVDVVANDDTPAPTPQPVDGFTLSAVGIGSAFEADDTLSAASRDHELGQFIKSQNGTWTIITDEVMAESHSKVFDQWVKVLTDSGKKKPVVIWHNQGKVLAIDEVAGKNKLDLLNLAKAVVPATRDNVVIGGKVHSLGLLPPKKGVKYAGPSVSKLLKPLSAEQCPSVDLSSQVRYYKNQVGGTCVLNSFAGACEAAIYTAYGEKNCLELSPYFLANLTNGYNGTYAAEAADMIQKYGNLPFGDMKPHANLPVGWKLKAPKYKCLAVYGPPESDSPGYIRAALNRGYIVCAGISVGSGFDPDADGYISYQRGAGRYVNHEIRVVGWDREKNRFKIANSWGKSWGKDGFAWLDAKFFEADNDLWVVVGMVANSGYQFYAPKLSDGKAWPWSRPEPTPEPVVPVLNPKITASATQIEAGDQVIVMWTNTPDTVLCTLNGQSVAINGQQEVYPVKDSTYAIIAYDKNANTQASWVRVDVLPKAQSEVPFPCVDLPDTGTECVGNQCPCAVPEKPAVKSVPCKSCNSYKYQPRWRLFQIFR